MKDVQDLNCIRKKCFFCKHSCWQYIKISFCRAKPNKTTIKLLKHNSYTNLEFNAHQQTKLQISPLCFKIYLQIWSEATVNQSHLFCLLSLSLDLSSSSHFTSWKVLAQSLLFQQHNSIVFLSAADEWLLNSKSALWRLISGLECGSNGSAGAWMEWDQAGSIPSPAGANKMKRPSDRLSMCSSHRRIRRENPSRRFIQISTGWQIKPVVSSQGVMKDERVVNGSMFIHKGFSLSKLHQTVTK